MKIVMDDENQSLAIFRNVLLQVAHKELFLKDIEHLSEALEELLSRCPQGIGIVTVVEAHAGTPQGTARDAMARLATQVSWGVACNAIIIEGDGFQAAAMRGFAASMNWMIRRSFPHQTFASVVDAAPWVARLLPPHNKITMRPSDLEKAFEELRARRSLPGLP